MVQGTAEIDGTGDGTVLSDPEVQPFVLPDPEAQPLVPLWPDGAKAIHCGRSQAFRLAAQGRFPVEVLTFGNRYWVRNADLRTYLKLP